MVGKGGHPLRRALWLDTLDRQLRSHLPATVGNRCRLANVDGEHLVFLVDSPVWHARVRLAEAAIIDAARSLGLTVTKVTIKTAMSPLHSPAQAGSTEGHRVKPATHAGLREALEALQDPGSGKS